MVTITQQRRQEIARRKLLNLLTRPQMEEIYQRGYAWHASKSTLIADALAHWDDDVTTAVRERIEQILKQAE